MIRKATPADIPKAIEIALEALAIDPYPELVVSQERVRAAVTECISSAAHFAWVSEIEGEVVGGIGALVTPMIFHERSQASILLWYCRTPGDGAALMHQFVSWCKSRPMIKQIQYTGERGADPRVGALAKRCGLRETLPLYLMNK